MSNTNLPTQTSSVLQNDTVSSCSTSKVQEKTQLSRIKCMNSLRAIQSQLKFLIETLQDFGNMPIFKRTFSQDLDLLENHLTKQIISQTDCKTTLTKLRTTFENAFSSEIKERMQNYTRYDAQSFYDVMIYNMDSLGKYMLELILHQQRYQLQKQLNKDECQEDGSLAAFWVINRQFQKFINSQFTLDYDMDVDLVVTKSSGTESEVQDESSRSGNDTDTDDVDIRPIYDEEPMAEVQLTDECNIFAIGQQHTEQPEIINEVRHQHYLPKKTESAFAKPDHMIASSSSRNSSKNMPRFSSNDMVHNHYLDVAKKKIQERDRNSTTSVTTSARFQSTADDSKPKPRSNNQTSRSLPVSKSTRVTINVYGQSRSLLRV
ncbi:hypothetical protein Tco_0945506 [Tanacetum coccineum]